MLGKPALFLLFSDPGKFFAYVKSVALEPTILILFARLFWIAATVLFFAGACLYAYKVGDARGLLTIAIVFYFMVTTLVIGLAVTGRYRLPVEVFIIIFAAYAAAPLVAKVRSRYGL